ncbi:MAG: DUF932 domain-containing protein [Planctomycetes bacterium]|nr:DUF932 domain-containing protein [Planctomycetota bacterium]
MKNKKFLKKTKMSKAKLLKDVTHYFKLVRKFRKKNARQMDKIQTLEVTQARHLKYIEELIEHDKRNNATIAGLVGERDALKAGFEVVKEETLDKARSTNWAAMGETYSELFLEVKELREKIAEYENLQNNVGVDNTNPRENSA